MSFRNLKLKTRLIIVLLVVGLVFMIIMLGYSTVEQGFDKSIFELEFRNINP